MQLYVAYTRATSSGYGQTREHSHGSGGHHTSSHLADDGCGCRAGGMVAGGLGGTTRKRAGFPVASSPQSIARQRWAQLTAARCGAWISRWLKFRCLTRLPCHTPPARQLPCSESCVCRNGTGPASCCSATGRLSLNGSSELLPLVPDARASQHCEIRETAADRETW